MYKWINYTDKQLMKMKLKDLDLDINKSIMLHNINKVILELKNNNISIPLTFWIGSEWCCPDDSYNVIIPFYLAHPRMINLEIEKTGCVEGVEEEYFVKLIRHEIGHVLDGLYSDMDYTKFRLFGDYSKKYPSSYIYNPHSKKYVKNLDNYYAQSHPSEDVAETFAIWLDPNSNWIEKYANTPAFSKLVFMEQYIKNLKIINRKNNVYSKEELNITLSEYYKRKNRRYKRKVAKNTVII